MAQSNNIVNLLEAGIKAEGIRQRAIASNMANIETPGYRRIDVRFDELLAKALSGSHTADLEKLQPEIYEPRNTPIGDDGNDVSMEAEVGNLLKNSLRHTAYVRLMQKKFAQIEAAISVGR